MSILKDHWDGEEAMHHGPALRLQPATLLSLPDELILLILNHLRPICSTSTFPPRPNSSISYQEDCRRHLPAGVAIGGVPTSYLAFSLVCKRAKELVTPLIYSMTVFTIKKLHQLASALEQAPSNGSLIRHVFFPSSSFITCDDRYFRSWSNSLSTVLKAASDIESLWMDLGAGNEWQNSFDAASGTQGGMVNLRRLTVKIGRIDCADDWEITAPKLTHLHLRQTYPSSLVGRLGRGILQSLRYLRLSGVKLGDCSRVPITSALDARESQAKKAFDEHIQGSANLRGLLLLRECIEEAKGVQVILLEPHPVCVSAWNALPLRRPLYWNIKQALVPFHRESVQLPEGSEDRMKRWSDLLRLKHLLIRYSQEVRHDGMSPIEFRVVAPRSHNWSWRHRRMDFHANAAACRGEEDVSCFMDEDVFGLVEKYPHLGHEYGKEDEGDWAYYWTGALPRAQ